MDYYKKTCSSKIFFSQTEGFYHKFYEVTINLLKKTTAISSTFSKDFDEHLISEVLKNNVFVKSTLNTFNNQGHKKKDAIQSKKMRLSLDKNKNLFYLLQVLNEAVVLAPEKENCFTVDKGFTLLIVLITRANLLLERKKFFLAYDDFQNIKHLNILYLNTAKLYQKLTTCFTVVKSLVPALSQTAYWKDTRELSWKKVKNSGFMSKLIEIKNTAFSGDEAAAKYVINPGDVLIIENPTASWLLSDYNFSHCQNCLKKLKISYGCPECSAVKFCSYHCRNTAVKSYHAYECQILPLLKSSGISPLSQLALRIITQLGILKCLKLYQYIKKGIKDFSDQDKQLCEYLKLFSLERNKSQRTNVDNYEQMVMAIFLTKCLKQTNFFDKLSDSYKKEVFCQETIIGILILQCLQFLQFNTHEICHNDILIDGSSKKKRQKLLRVGLGIYPNSSKFNHQCYATVMRCFSGKTVIIRSTRLLEANDIIGDNYGPTFLKNNRYIRHRQLKGHYWFKCSCEACIKNWPTLSFLSNNEILLRCQKENCTWCTKIKLDESHMRYYTCKKCKETQELYHSLVNVLKHCILRFAYGTTVNKISHTPEAIQILSTALRNFYHLASPPYRLMHLAEIELSQSYSDLHYSKI